MLSQRLCMLLLALDSEGREHAAATLDVDHAAMLRAARAAVASGPLASHGDAANDARAHADAFLAGMNQIVAQYEHEARDRVVTLRRTELGLLILALLVLAAEGLFVFRPAVRGLRAYLVDRDEALRRLLDVSDREQQRIAQDLHDGLSQHLVGISYLVKSLEQEVGDTPARARVTEIGQLIGESIESTRRLARSLHSSTLDADGLEPALLELALYTERLFGVPCHVDVAAAIDVPVEIRRRLYRIAREGVLNAARHARELQVLEMMGRGLGTREIAELLRISIKTVESYRARLKEKMNLRSGTELLRFAMAWSQDEKRK